MAYLPLLERFCCANHLPRKGRLSHTKAMVTVMDFIGRWEFHSVGVRIGDEVNLTYMNAEEYIASPMPYIDENDSEAVEEERSDRRTMTRCCIEVSDDGMVYMLMPIPDGAAPEEVEAAVEAGEIKLRGGMMCGNGMAWEIRDGELWYDTGIEGEVFGEKAETWTRALDEEGYFVYITSRFKKVM